MRLPASFLRIRARYSSRPALPYPEVIGLRAVQISSVAPFAFIDKLPYDRWAELGRIRPQLLIATIPDLRSLIERLDLNPLDLTGLDHAIFVVTRCGEPPLCDVVRAELWHTFRVPVYELFTGRGNTLLAHECVAAEGWHFEPGVRFALSAGELVLTTSNRESLPTGLTGRLISEPCECGSTAPRIRDIVCLADRCPDVADEPAVAALTGEPAA